MLAEESDRCTDELALPVGTSDIAALVRQGAEQFDAEGGNPRTPYGDEEAVDGGELIQPVETAHRDRRLHLLLRMRHPIHVSLSV